MPAPIEDPVAQALRASLGVKGGKRVLFHEDDTETSADVLEDRLAASASRVLHTNLEYELAPKQQSLVLNKLKSKYILLNSFKTAEEASPMKQGMNGTLQSKGEEMLPQPKITLYNWEDVEVGWRKNMPVGAGMVNMGNTCYMNSTLQALFHVPSLVNWLLNDKSHFQRCEQNPNASQQCTICAMAKTLRSTHERSGNVVKPMLVYSKLKMICKHMVHGRQEDAHEFMRYLIESMEKAYLYSVGALKFDSRSKETTPLNQIFGGYIRTEVVCLRCRHTSTTFQHFQDLCLDIAHGSTLEDALSHYFRREKLDGDNAYKCEHCKTKVPATKKFSIERPPHVLCIQLKRFGVFGGKVSKHIQYGKQLNLGRYITGASFAQSPGAGSSAPDPPLLYKFVSLINHMGPSQNCGHYTAMAEASNGQLYIFDDSSVRVVSANAALSTGAYVLIYERVGPVKSLPLPYVNKTVSSGQNAGNTSSCPSSAVIRNGIQSPATNGKINILQPRPALIPAPSSNKEKSLVAKHEVQKPRLVIHQGSKLVNSALIPPRPPLLAPAKPTSTNSSQLNGVNGSLVPYDSDSDESVKKDKDEKPIQASSSTSAQLANGTVNTNNDNSQKNKKEPNGEASMRTPMQKPKSLDFVPRALTVNTSQTSLVRNHSGSWDVMATSLKSPSVKSDGSTNSTANWKISEAHPNPSLNKEAAEKKWLVTPTKKPAEQKSQSDTEMIAKPKPTTLNFISEKFKAISGKVKDFAQKAKKEEEEEPLTTKPATESLKRKADEAELGDERKEKKKKKSKKKSKKKNKEKEKVEKKDEKKKRKRSTSASSSSSESTEWVEKTKETLVEAVVVVEPSTNPKAAAVTGPVKKWDEPAAKSGDSSKDKEKATWNGVKQAPVVQELLKMSHSGFSAHVRTWDGGKNEISKEMERDRREEKRQHLHDLEDEEMDKGRTKKVKRPRSPSPANARYNPFQAAQNERYDRRQSGECSGNSSRDNSGSNGGGGGGDRWDSDRGRHSYSHYNKHKRHGHHGHSRGRGSPFKDRRRDSKPWHRHGR